MRPMISKQNKGQKVSKNAQKIFSVMGGGNNGMLELQKREREGERERERESVV